MKAVVEHLQGCGYDCSIDEEGQYLMVSLYVVDTPVHLLHQISETSLSPNSLPGFFLLNAIELMPLAHVMLATDGSVGSICVGDHESLSINFEKPELVFEESLKRHVELISKAVGDSEWNRLELLREFKTNWQAVAEGGKSDLVLPPNLQRTESFSFAVKSPVPNQTYGLDSKHIGCNSQPAQNGWMSQVTESSISRKRAEAGEAIVLPIHNISPAPFRKEDIGSWYLDFIDGLDDKLKGLFFKKHAQTKRSRVWLVFCAETPSGITWFGLRFEHKKKKKSTLPITQSRLNNWTVRAINVIPYSRDFILPRGGAKINLNDKKVLLVGCGSVGGELANRLASSGIGHLTLSDPDTYQPENLYRHCLPEFYTGYNKALSLEYRLKQQYLWANIQGQNFTLLQYRDKELLETFDLVVVAIGSPTHERLFHDFLRKERVTTPVIYTWLEGYGVGGHAILDCSSSAGCLRCAYIDHSTLEHGLASNLNFIEAGQSVTVNHAGCGQNFLPYGSNSSVQTALIASDLAIKYLMGLVTESSKVSWKGGNSDALSNGINTTYRYKHFDRSLVIEPLADVLCECGVQ